MSGSAVLFDSGGDTRWSAGDQQPVAERTRPSGPVVMLQRWERLLFLHWKWDPDEVQRSLPPGLTLETFQGVAWLRVRCGRASCRQSRWFRIFWS